MAKLGDKPTVSIPAACGGWRETRAAYRLFDHPEVSAERVQHQERLLTDERKLRAVIDAAPVLTEITFDRPPSNGRR